MRRYRCEMPVLVWLITEVEGEDEDEAWETATARRDLAIRELSPMLGRCEVGTVDAHLDYVPEAVIEEVRGG